jgi:CheY-like chemotaxis protein
VSAEEDVDVAQPVSGSQDETILVVEDDPDVRTYSCETLAELGYTVVAAENGAAALRLLASNPQVNVLFSDIGLPGGMNGRQLSEEARKLRPDLKVLFTTGYARNAIVHDGRLDPGVELITKPFTQAALAEKLRNILDAKHVPGRILLVEDEALIQMLATDYLEEAGFKVDVAGSATEAMNKLGLVPGGVDAVIIDMRLPDRGGDALFAEIRTIYPSLPTVLATGQSVAELREAFQGQRNVGFVAKPYTAENLLGALRKVGLRAFNG